MSEQTLDKSSRQIFLDTNILVYLSQQSTREQILAKLKNYFAKDKKLAISRITRYEILRNDSKDESALLKLLNLFETYEVNEKVLVFSAFMYSFFKEKDKDKKLDDPDVIIATTAFLNNSQILTTNSQDFHFPYFEEIEVTPILYSFKPGKTNCLLLSLLKPNISLLLQKIGSRLPK